MKNGFEIERKFLIKYPDIKALCRMNGCRVMEMEQSYIKDGGRIRKVVEQGEEFYIKTVKRHITDIKREEKEWQISREEYIDSLKSLEKSTTTIVKTRYAIPLFGFIYEIDVFPFWNDRAFMEVELNSENQQFPIPEFVSIIKEVTEDKRYRNSSLARKIVTEDII